MAASEAEYRSLTQIIAEKLRKSIYDGSIFDGEYGPGSRLNIADLAKRMNASAIPVREALRRLEAEDLVEFRVNRGVVVRQLSASELRELFLVRLPLEKLAAAEAARFADATAVKALTSILKDMDKMDYGPAWHTMHERFHQELYALSRLPRLCQLIAGLRGQMRPYAKLYQDDPEQRRRIQFDHYALLTALRRHDAQKIAKIVGEHISRPARLALAKLSEGPELAADFTGH
ncbi:MAG: GntR family transcriptional regulator [Hyphomicrobiales bacterium]|nr:GntR family transcriptional regulator [Hyphomicrobiales bacterium]